MSVPKPEKMNVCEMVDWRIHVDALELGVLFVWEEGVNVRQKMKTLSLEALLKRTGATKK